MIHTIKCRGYMRNSKSTWTPGRKLEMRWCSLMRLIYLGHKTVAQSRQQVLALVLGVLSDQYIETVRLERTFGAIVSTFDRLGRNACRGETAYCSYFGLLLVSFKFQKPGKNRSYRYDWMIKVSVFFLNLQKLFLI